MASMKEIKRRRDSIISTSQITKAMKLVATVKLQKTKQIATDSIPYFNVMYDTMASVLKKSASVNNKYIKNVKDGKKGLVVISSNRGLAGGYNSNIVREILKEDSQYNFTKDNTIVYSIGNKVKEALLRKGFSIEAEFNECLDNPDINVAKDVSKYILNDYVDGKISEIYLVYTYFKNTLVHIPRILKLLPLNIEDRIDDNEDLYSKKDMYKAYKSEYENDDKLVMNFEPEDELILNMLIPQYITSLLYGGMTSSIASENGARMTAMDAATNNANEIIENLSVKYNRARQGAITQEITEIVAGANAI